MKIIYVLVVLVLSVNECRADGFKIKGRIVGGGEGVKVFRSTGIFMIVR